jgi:hypothetical protein
VLIQLHISFSIKNSNHVQRKTADCESEYHIIVTNVKNETDSRPQLWRAGSKRFGKFKGEDKSWLFGNGVDADGETQAFKQAGPSGSQYNPPRDLAFT